ncbi:DUF4369 domain-containing protein [Dysgonomonas sp. 216]|uniref:TlpA disulfide reductase family protein n=1 Tax=Dysgonomonas sp. 216 TaxID=2302934 RepID=UPI0013D4D742|nr:TlpA disulfide reductase family protein [Dysgonomonas sp. 216]NDW17524.1 DUF4369 domain-containing protein [Dysgonomonas sp. 216]
MSIFKFLTLAIVTGSLFFISCNNKPVFTVEGSIENAEGSTIYFERRGLNELAIIDSLKLDNNGNFKFETPAQSYPEFYILKLDNQTINISADSTETVTVKSSKKNFATNYTISGSESSQRIKEIVLANSALSLKLDSLKKEYDSKNISAEIYIEAMNNVLNNTKSQLINIIAQNLQSPSAYFAIFQKLDGYLIFDPKKKEDLRYYTAVANAWITNYENSPRTEQLKMFTYNMLAQSRAKEKSDTLTHSIKEVTAAEAYNVELPDISGKKISLTSLQGKVVILDFTAYQTEYSPGHNIQINKVYEKYKNNIEVFQVSFDTDIHFWENASSNLPWICVRDKQSLQSSLISQFNIQELPTTYLLNKNGEIVKRMQKNDNLEAEIKKLI